MTEPPRPKEGGKIFIDEIEDKYRFYWNDDDLI